MTSESAMLHTMERLVSSLLQAKSEESVVMTVEMGVSCCQKDENGIDVNVVFPAWDKNEADKWEKNRKDGFRTRQVTFTGRHVSVAFPQRASVYGTKPDQTFGAEIWSNQTLQTFRSNNRWNLALVQTWEDRPYYLHYECQGATIRLSETARDEEWNYLMDQSIRQNNRRRAEQEEMDKASSDRRWREWQKYGVR